MRRIQRQQANLGSPQRGGALAASLALVVLIAGMGAGLVQVVSSTARRQATGFDSMRALYVAEAGLAEGFLALAQGRTGDVGTPAELASFGGGMFWVTHEDLTDGLVQLTSNGLFGRGRSTLSIVVEPNSNPIGSLGISSLGQMEIGAGANLQAVDSSAPALAPPSSGAQVRSNGDILLHSIQNNQAGALPGESTEPVDDEFPDSKYAGAGNTTVIGDTRPGVEGTVEYEPGAIITGSTAPSVQSISTPAVRIPRGGDLEGELSVSGPQVLSGRHRLDSLTVQRDGNLTLAGPLVLVVGKLTAMAQANLTIDSKAGPVEIFVRKQLDIQANSTLANVGEDPTQVALIVGAPERDWGGELPIREQRLLANGDFHGLIYAPYSQLKIGGGVHLTGAASGGQLHLGPGATVAYDVALRNAGVGVRLAPLQVAWTVEPLTDDPLMRSSADVSIMLDLLGRTSVPASDAYSTYDAEVHYTDGMGLPQSFTGDVRTLDWTQVQSIGTVAWDDPLLGTYGPPRRPSIVVDPDPDVDPDTSEVATALATPL